MIPRELVLAAAPSPLRNHRRSRSRGDERALDLAAFSEQERRTVEALYAALGDLADALRSGAASTTTARAELRDRLTRLLRYGDGAFHGAAMDDAVAEALHDVRGGTMTALLFGLGAPARPEAEDREGTALLSLVRDQRKIIRNVVRDVDVEALARDMAKVPHSLADLDAGLSSFAMSWNDAALEIVIHRDADAVVADSCLEFASLERAVFNVLNNAARHVDGHRLDVWLIPLESDARIAVANPIAPAAAASLAAALAADPARLYGGFTTTGSGLGLGIVADVVGNAYGLGETEEMVAEGYIGTRIVESSFLTWLHWPLSR